MSNARELSQLAPLVTVDANNKITFASTSEVEFGGLAFPATDGSNGQVLTTDGAGNLTFTSAAGGGLAAIVQDETPQLGGNLDVNDRLIYNDTGTVKLQAGSADYVTIVNSGGADRIRFSDIGGIAALGRYHQFGDSTATRGLVNIMGSTSGFDVGSGALRIHDSDSSAHVELTIPATVSANVAFTLPGADGSNGQVLTTDGAGNLSFADASGGIADIVEDTTPQLGGNLDTVGNTITSSSANLFLTGSTQTGGQTTQTGYVWINGADSSSGQSGTVYINGVGGGSFDPADVGNVYINYQGNNGQPYGTTYIGSTNGLNGGFYDNEVQIRGLWWPDADGSNGQVLTTDGSGNLSFADASGGIADIVEDTTPQLGGTLDTNGNEIEITSGSRIAAYSGNDIFLNAYGAVGNAGNINLQTAAEGGDRGNVIIDGIKHPNSDGSNGQVLTTDGSGNLSFTTISGGISNVVEDTTPQLGGNLDLNGKYIGHANAYMKAYDFGTGSQFAVYMQGELSAALEIYSNMGSSIANVTIKSDLTVSGGDITLGGTGRIQGIDTVSADTDAANKLYVDNAVAGAGGGFAQSYMNNEVFN